MLLFLLFSVVSGQVIQNNIIPSELDDRCHAGLRLSKTKPDQFTSISCANIRYETTMKTVNFGTKSITDIITDYPVEFDQGICKLKDIVYQPLDEDPFVAVVQNSYGYCSGDDGGKPHHDSARVSNVSCEQEGFRSIYTPNECGLHGDYGDTIPDDKTLFNKDIPWGCLKKEGSIYLNMYAKDDLPADAKNTSYETRNTRLRNIINKPDFGWDRENENRLYLHKRKGPFWKEALALTVKLDSLFNLRKPSQGAQYLDEISNMQAQYQYLGDVTYKVGHTNPARGIDWRLEHNKVFFSYDFYRYVNNMTRRGELSYREKVVKFNMLKKQFEDTKTHLQFMDAFEIDLTNLYIYMNDIENIYKTANHINKWFKHLDDSSVEQTFASIRSEFTRAYHKLREIENKVTRAKDYIANALINYDTNALRTQMQTAKEFARSFLSESITTTLHERGRPVPWVLTDADKCAIFGFAGCNTLENGHVINKLWDSDGRPDWTDYPDCTTNSYENWQCNGDYDSDGESARQELEDIGIVLDPNYRVHYQYLGVFADLSLGGDAFRNKYPDAPFRVLGTQYSVDQADTLVDNIISGLVVPGAVPIITNKIQEQVYTFNKHESLDTCIHNGSPKVPVLGPDRFQNRLNIHQEIVNREHKMVEETSMNTSQLLDLHQLKEEQPVLCGEAGYDCQCYETESNKRSALRTCTEECGEGFRHFWDQSEPRLTSKMLVHGRSECICMESVLSERECVLANRQWINELYVTQYNIEPQVVDIPVRYDDLFLYCPVIECSDGLVKERCSYSGGICEQGWFSRGVCYSEKPGCDGFTYEECMCGATVCKPGKYCDGQCKNLVPNDKKLLHLAYINYD